MIQLLRPARADSLKAPPGFDRRQLLCAVTRVLHLGVAGGATGTSAAVADVRRVQVWRIERRATARIVARTETVLAMVQATTPAQVKSRRARIGIPPCASDETLIVRPLLFQTARFAAGGTVVETAADTAPRCRASQRMPGDRRGSADAACREIAWQASRRCHARE